MIFSPFFFSYFEFSVESWKKSLGSASKNRVGQETGNKPFFFWPYLNFFYFTSSLFLALIQYSVQVCVRYLFCSCDFCSGFSLDIIGKPVPSSYHSLLWFPAIGQSPVYKLRIPKVPDVAVIHRFYCVVWWFLPLNSKLLSLLFSNVIFLWYLYCTECFSCPRININPQT